MGSLHQILQTVTQPYSLHSLAFSSDFLPVEEGQNLLWHKFSIVMLIFVLFWAKAFQGRAPTLVGENQKLFSSGYVHIVLDSETERRRKCTG